MKDRTNEEPSDPKLGSLPDDAERLGIDSTQSGGKNGEVPAETETWMEQVLDATNMQSAWQRVRRNGGSPGMDGMTIVEPPGAEPHAGWCGRGDRRNPVTSTRFLIPWSKISENNFTLAVDNLASLWFNGRVLNRGHRAGRFPANAKQNTNMKTKQLIYFIENRAAFRAFSAGGFKVGAAVKVVGLNGRRYESGQSKIDAEQAVIIAIDGDSVTVNSAQGTATLPKNYLSPRAADGAWESAWVALLKSNEAVEMMQAEIRRVAAAVAGRNNVKIRRDGSLVEQTGTAQDGHSIIGNELGVSAAKAAIRVQFIQSGGSPWESEYLTHRDKFLAAATKNEA